MYAIMKCVKLLLYILIVLGSLIIISWAINPSMSPSWTGFAPYDVNSQEARAKTLWDWLDLLIIPIILSVSVWWLNKKEKEIENKIENDRQCHKTLESYLDCMTNLLLKENLRSPSVMSEAINIARTRTLTVLRSLDGNGKGEVLQFLYESGLINNRPIIQLTGANFSGAILKGATLQNVEIRGANFEKANFFNANLSNASLYGCDFQSADFRKCNFNKTKLDQSILDKANLSGVDLSTANLFLVTFRHAKLTHTQFSLNQFDDIGYIKRTNKIGVHNE
jgi:hypothetical protein